MGFPARSHRPVLGAGLLLRMQGDTQASHLAGRSVPGGVCAFLVFKLVHTERLGYLGDEKVLPGRPPRSQGQPQKLRGPCSGAGFGPGCWLIHKWLHLAFSGGDPGFTQVLAAGLAWRALQRGPQSPFGSALPKSPANSRVSIKTHLHLELFSSKKIKFWLLESSLPGLAWDPWVWARPAWTRPASSAFAGMKWTSFSDGRPPGGACILSLLGGASHIVGSLCGCGINKRTDEWQESQCPHSEEPGLRNGGSRSQPV